MLCEKCGSAVIRIEHPEPGVRNALCAGGHRSYFFRLDNGCWESQEERCVRMASYRICDDCGQEFTEAADRNRMQLTLCAACKRTHLQVSNRMSYFRKMSEGDHDHRGIKGELEPVL